MKNLILCLFVATFAVGCSDAKKDIPFEKEEPRTKPDDGSTEVPRKLNIDVSDKDGSVAMAEVLNGPSFIAGDKGVWSQGQKLENVSITEKGKYVAMDINSDGNVIAAGSKGLFINWNLQDDVNLGSKDSMYAVDINDKGEWIAAGDAAVYIKRENSNKAVLINGLHVVAKKNQQIVVRIFEDSSWVVVSSNGVWTNSESSAGTSQMQGQGLRSRVLSVGR